MEFDQFLRLYEFIPIRVLGRGGFDQIVAMKIFRKEHYDQRELDAVKEFMKQKKENIYVVKYLSYYDLGIFPFLIMEYANMKTVEIIAKLPQITLPTCVHRALMKQICKGMQIFHTADLIHRDIKCDNILLHSPPGSGRVYAKISDFGFAKKSGFEK